VTFDSFNGDVRIVLGGQGRMNKSFEIKGLGHVFRSTNPFFNSYFNRDNLVTIELDAVDNNGK